MPRCTYTKRFLSTILASVAFLQSCTPKDTWWVGQTQENGHRVIIRAREHLPDAAIRSDHPWLGVITWRYSPQPDGMPVKADYERMKDFEDTIEQKVESTGICVQSSSRTGNGRKEWSYYVRDREKFLEALNTAIRTKPRFPIQTRFLHDPDWKSLRETIQTGGR